jgi:hypothetical protein
MAYKLADNSLSTDYEVGDEFIFSPTIGPYVGVFVWLSTVELFKDDGSKYPLFKLVEGLCEYNNAKGAPGAVCSWEWLVPTDGTKRKVQARKHKDLARKCNFAINVGDYIDSREFTQEECDIFCDIAVKCGAILRDKDVSYYTYLGVSDLNRTLACNIVSPKFTGLNNNITQKFKYFLNKDRAMNKFTKDDFKNGMMCEHRSGTVTTFVDGEFWVVKSDSFKLRSLHTKIAEFDKYLYLKYSRNVLMDFDIMKVTDRDGTILFEREPEKTDITCG